MNRPDARQTVIGSVGALAVGAAFVSFSHTYGLARAAHQTAIVAAAYPILTDVLVLSATVCLLYAAKHKITKAALPRWAFALGVLATGAANTGDYFRPIPAAVGAVVSGWSAVAFILGVLLAHWFSGATENLQMQNDHEVSDLRDLKNVKNDNDHEVSDLETKAEPATEIKEIFKDLEPAAVSSAPQPSAVVSSAPQKAAAASKTDRVLDALQAARAKGETPTAASLAEQCDVSPTLARNVVRAASNGKAA